ncbi:MAG: helix-turn-helix domain-containing protein, partial [Marinilabiliaceae bacterium]
LIGVQRSSISHILSGRNNPSLDFLRKILLHLEHINPDWLISGKGPYKRNPEGTTHQNTRKHDPLSEKQNTTPGRLEFPEKSPVKDEDRVPYFHKNQENPSQKQQGWAESPDGYMSSPNSPSTQGNVPVNKKEEPSKQRAPAALKQKNIIKTVFFYDDQTFDVFYPSS